MFEKMRNAKRELTAEEAKEILARGEYGILSTMGPDGYPYGVPVSYVFDGEKIGFHCAADAGKKLENIMFNAKVSFTVVGDTEVLPEKFSTRYESAVVFGTARKAEDKKAVLKKLIEKYSPDFMESGMDCIERAAEKTGVYEIEIVHMTGKARR